MSQKEIDLDGDWDEGTPCYDREDELRWIDKMDTWGNMKNCGVICTPDCFQWSKWYGCCRLSKEFNQKIHSRVYGRQVVKLLKLKGRKR